MSKLEILKKLCKDRGITINRLEQELGFSQGSLGKIDTNMPKADKLYALARYFNIPMETFFGDEEIHIEEERHYPHHEQTDFVMKLLQNKELYVLIENILNASTEDRERYIQMAKLMGLL